MTRPVRDRTRLLLVAVCAFAIAACRPPSEPAADGVATGVAASEPASEGSAAPAEAEGSGSAAETEGSGSAAGVPASAGAEAVPADVALAAVGGTGGARYATRCGFGMTVVGLHGGAGQVLDGLGVLCADGLGNSDTLIAAGGDGGQPFEARCADGQAMVAIRGGAAALVDGIHIGCAPFEEAFAAGAAVTPTFGERIGGAGGQPFERQCPAGTAVVGIEGQAGVLLDGITLICGLPSEESHVHPEPSVRRAYRSRDGDSAAGTHGFLGVSSSPRGRVFVDGEDTGEDTPVRRMQTPTGAHEVQIRYPDGTLSEVKHVGIRPWVNTNVFFRQTESPTSP